MVVVDVPGKVEEEELGDGAFQVLDPAFYSLCFQFLE